jgi:hypothetical protein
MDPFMASTFELALTVVGSLGFIGIVSSTVITIVKTKADGKSGSDLARRVEALEKKLALLDSPEQVENRLKVLEEIVVDREMKQR